MKSRSNLHCMVSNTKFSFLDTKPRAKRAADAKISTEVAVPLQQQRTRFKISRSGLSTVALRMDSLEIDFPGLRCAAISALAVNQVYLGSPETRILAGKSVADAEILVLQGRTIHRNQ